MDIVSIVILAIVQGAAELLPVSSSAHVIVAARLLGHDPGDPAFVFFMIMLHAGTIGAVIIYFFKRWKALLSGSAAGRNQFVSNVALASAVTAAVGLTLKYGIEHYYMGGRKDARFEELARNQTLISISLFAAGALIIYSGWRSDRGKSALPLSFSSSFVIGFVQGICLPFRGFSRSGATISSALVVGHERQLAEEFSFALAVVLTPAATAWELRHLIKDANAHARAVDLSLFMPGLEGMVLSFLSGLLALRFLSSWLEKGRWAFFGYYCLAFSAVVLILDQTKR